LSAPSSSPTTDARSEALVQVAVPVPNLDLLTYAVPDGTPVPPIGARVVVPLGSRIVTGIVVENQRTENQRTENHRTPNQRTPNQRTPNAERRTRSPVL
jgi:primosomal protein N'